jgi:hypothetical protein
VRRFPVCVVAAVFAVGGCGGSSDTVPASDAAGKFVSALAVNNSATACSLLAPQAVRRIVVLRPEGCPEALPTLGLPADRPDKVEVWSDTAQIKTKGDTLFLRKFPEGWRIVGAGCVPHGEEPYECKVDGT